MFPLFFKSVILNEKLSKKNVTKKVVIFTIEFHEGIISTFRITKNFLFQKCLKISQMKKIGKFIYVIGVTERYIMYNFPLFCFMILTVHGPGFKFNSC